MSGTWRSRHYWRQDNSIASDGPEKHSDRPHQPSHDANRDQKEWRRGQRLPSPPPESRKRTGWKDPDESQGNVQTEQQTSIKSDGGSERKRATFASATNAWGNNLPSSNLTQSAEVETASGSTATKEAMLKKTETASVAGSSAPKYPPINKALTSAPARRQDNPWGRLESNQVKPKTPSSTIFPSLIIDADKSKQSSNLSSESAEPKATVSSKSAEPKATAPLSLPTNSLWGKRNTQTNNDTKGNDRPAKQEDFPSLSSAASKPQSMHQSIPSLNSSVPAAPTRKERNAKGKSPNLAHFLPSQFTSNTKNKAASSSSRSKKKSATKAVTAVKKKSAGVKRSVAPPTNAIPGNKLQNLHPSIIDNGAPLLKKGRHRLTPKKKKLSTLKKRVLEERLRVWKEMNGDGVPSVVNNDKEAPTSSGEEVSSTIVIENFVRPNEDDLNDDDEYDEILSNVISLAGRVGNITSIFVPRPAMLSNDQMLEDEGVKPTQIAFLEAAHVGSCFVRFTSCKDAVAGQNILNGVVVGGQKIIVSSLKVDSAEPLDDDQRWKLRVLESMNKRLALLPSYNDVADSKRGMALDSTPINTICFHNILTDDDYEDTDALAESIEDISSLAATHGQITEARASTTGIDRRNVYVTYATDQDATNASKQMNGIVIGGSQILVTVQAESPHFKANSNSGSVEVILENVLNHNDFEDEDCLSESIDDISNVARRFGVIGTVHAITTGEHKGRVHIEFVEGESAAQLAVQQLHGMLIGGQAVSAWTSSFVQSNLNPSLAEKESVKEKQTAPPIYSGEKIIPERFAECKRVPKIPSSGPRSYAVKINDDRAVPLLIEMLGELMRLQQRSKDDKNARSRRRLVMGLREVARGIRAHKVKMVVMANNLDEYGAIDAKLQEILEIARAEDVPVVFEFNKRKLGKAIGKSIKVAVVGIQSADGAQEQFKKLKKIIGVL